MDLERYNQFSPRYSKVKQRLFCCFSRRKLERSRPISIRDFKSWVKRSSSDDEFRFAEEYESMRDLGKSEKHEAAEKTKNRAKNRFNNILPYDFSRVRLKPIDGVPCSDYINASYIDGYKQPRAYIAAQGPLEETTNDFWRMVWEQKSTMIVMITRCTERIIKRKCHQYWPTQGLQRFGNITVTPVDEKLCPHWTERKFILECGEESRFLRQVQFTSWPDHGVPDSPTEVLKFMERLRDHQLSNHDNPTIVHCSAGVGRTGTYICIDILLNKLQHENHIDVYGVVCSMRSQRCNMVQTEEQYIFIHHVMLEYLYQKEKEHGCVGPRPSLISISYHEKKTHHNSDEEKMHHNFDINLNE